MKYVVLKDFLDRFDNLRHCKPGEPHVPPNDERAKQLIAQGFIAAVEEEPQRTQRGRKNEVKEKDARDDAEADSK
ncbi:hypothetical protein [Brevibacillus borstelensis]